MKDKNKGNTQDSIFTKTTYKEEIFLMKNHTESNSQDIGIILGSGETTPIQKPLKTSTPLLCCNSFKTNDFESTLWPMFTAISAF